MLVPRAALQGVKILKLLREEVFKVVIGRKRRVFASFIQGSITGLLLLALGCLGWVFFFTDILRDYPTYCSSFIAEIEAFQDENGGYPDDLESLPYSGSLLYEKSKCEYKSSEDGYGFYVPYGLIGEAIYSSEWEEWKYD